MNPDRWAFIACSIVVGFFIGEELRLLATLGRDWLRERREAKARTTRLCAHFDAASRSTLVHPHGHETRCYPSLDAFLSQVDR